MKRLQRVTIEKAANGFVIYTSCDNPAAMHQQFIAKDEAEVLYLMQTQILLVPPTNEPAAPPAVRRTKAEVLEARRHGPAGGCCDRWADFQACDCLERAT